MFNNERVQCLHAWRCVCLHMCASMFVWMCAMYENFYVPHHRLTLPNARFVRIKFGNFSKQFQTVYNFGVDKVEGKNFQLEKIK